MTIQTVEINALIEACKKNDVRAQTEVYRKYAKGMFHVALRIVKNEMDAEDVMQEGFMKAFEKLNQFSGEVTFGAWLKRIIVNHSIDWYKKNKLMQWEEIDSKLIKTPIEDEDEDFDYQKLKVQEVYKVIHELKENYRMILTLIYIEGYDQEEVCEILNISYSNCRTMFSRAKEHLRIKLNEKAR